MLVVFMNSSAKIWEEVRRAIDSSGFVLVSADIFDKQHGTFKHFVSENTPGADLVLHCLKPLKSSGTAQTLFPARGLQEFLDAAKSHDYVQRFLHVNRAEEPDMRRLYSEWIAESAVSGAAFIDFPAFREQVCKAWKVDS
jgi:hypothetical protein